LAHRNGCGGRSQRAGMNSVHPGDKQNKLSIAA
jgi:hypothetical protein